MKKKQSVIGLLTLMVLLLASCSGFYGTGTDGNGTVITENRKVTSFSKIEMNGVFNLILNQGEKEVVQIETDENLIDFFEVDVADNTLFIGLKENTEIGDYTKLNIFVTLVDINQLKMNGVGDVSVENTLNLDNLEIENVGVGDINLALDCDKVSVVNSAVGDINLSGQSTSLDIVNSAVGDISTEDLKSKTVTVNNSGVGDVKVHASKSITIESSGVGDVTYYGNPDIKNIENNAVGDVVSK